MYKKYYTEAKALRAYYGARSANLVHQPAPEIEEKPTVRTVASWSWRDAMLVLMAVLIAFLIGKLM